MAYTANGGWVTVEYQFEKQKVKGKFRAVLKTQIVSGNKVEITPYIEISNKFEKDVKPYFNIYKRDGKMSKPKDVDFSSDKDDINEYEREPYIKGANQWTGWACRKQDPWINRGNYTHRLAAPMTCQDVTLQYKVRVKYKYTTSYEKTEKVYDSKKKKWVKKKVTKYKEHTGKSEVSLVKVDYTQVPFQPVLITYGKEDATDAAVALRATFNADVDQPLRSAKLQKQSDLRQNEWSDTGRTTNFGITGDTDNGIITNGSEWKVTDQALATGTKWRYRVVAQNTKGESHAETRWIYGYPPPVDELTAQRLPNNDKVALLHIRRDALKLSRSLIRGYLIEYNDNPDDIGVGTNWKTLVKVIDDNTDGRRTRVYTISAGNTVRTSDGTKGASSVPWTDSSIGEFDFQHIGLAGDAGYRYRLRTINKTNHLRKYTFSAPEQIGKDYTPSSSGTDIVYTTPNPPSSVVVVRNVDLSRTLTINKVNNRTTADTMYIERQLDGGLWVPITEDGVAISNTYTDSEIIESRSVAYRVAFANKAGFSNPVLNNGLSGWRTSAVVLMIDKPNPPTLTAPLNNTKVNIENPYHRLVWVHNPKDMRDQTKYKIAISFNNSRWYEIEGTGSSAYYDLTINKLNEIAASLDHTLAEKDKIYWKVRTMATEEMGYGDYCAAFNFVVIGKPKVSIIKPLSGSEINLLPVHIEWTYVDNSGDKDPVEVTIAIKKNNRVLKTYKLADLKAREYDIKQYLFDNLERYTFELTFVSSSTYSTTVSFDALINYSVVTLKDGLVLSHEFDEVSGYTTVTLSAPLSETEQETMVPEISPSEDIEQILDISVDGVSVKVDDDTPEEPEPLVIDSPLELVYLYRNYDGERTLVESFTANEIGGTEDNEITFIDYYTPINRPFTYELLQLAENGGISLTIYDGLYGGGTNPILWWYVIWEDEDETLSVRSRWNPSIDVTMTRPEKQQVRYSGRKYPVVYDSVARSETASYSMVLYENPQVEDNGWETLRLYRQMMHDGAHGVWKSFEGDVYTADFDFNYGANYSDKIRSWNCTLNVTRTESEE